MSYETLVGVHLIAGTVALVAFWVQMPLRKAGARHRVVGRIYLLAMGIVVVTAIPMTVVLSRGQRWGAAVFLGFLVWITVSAGSGALLAARLRSDKLELQRRIARVQDVGTLLISLTMLALGHLGGALFYGLGVLGLWIAFDGLRLAADSIVWRSWVVRHLQGMLGTGIAVHVAFLAFGLRGVLGDSYTNYHFLAAFAVPTVVGVAASSWLTNRYGGAVELRSGTAEASAEA